MSQTTSPGPWRTASLGVSCLKVRKVDPKVLGRETFRYVDIGAIDNGKNAIRHIEPIECESAPSRARQLLQTGDTVFSTVRPYLKNIAWVDDSLNGEIASTGFCVLRPDSKKLLPRFLFLFSLSDVFLEQILPLQRGVSYPAVRDGDLLGASIPLPPLAEQERIVEILEEQLSRLDAAVESVQTVREKAAQFRLSLLEDAVVRGKFDERSEPRRIVELGDLVDAKSDIVDGPFGSNLKSEHYTSEGARVIRLQNIGYGEFRDERAFISQDHFHRLQKHNVQGGDLLFASLGENLPRTCLMPEIDEQAIVKADCIRVRLSSKVDRRYVLHATQTPTARQWALEQLHGLGRPRLGLGNIRKFPVALPSLRTQQRIAELVDSELERVSHALVMADEVERKAVALRRSMLHAAFTGELTRSWREAHV